jgi:hypothetical protein
MKSKNYEDRHCGNPSVLILLLSFKSKYSHHLLEHLRRDFVVKSFSAVRGEKRWKDKGEARRRRVCLSMYSVTENNYY